MMSLNCPLTICHKKGKYILMEIGGVLLVLELQIVSRSFFYMFFWLVMYLFSYGLYMLGGDIMFFISVSCFTCATLAIDLYYEVIHDICLLFYVFVKSRSYFVYLYFPHMHLCVC